MMNDRTFPIPSNTISVKSEDYTNKSLQMDSNPATMEVSGASCRSVRAKFSAYSRVIRKAGCASHAQKHPRFGQMCKRCAESVQPLSYIKKNVKSYDLTFNIWCTSRTHIRTFLRFHSFPESDRFCTFLIVKGNEDLIIVEIDGIDEGIHQCLPLLRLGHIQLTETEQPSQSNFFNRLQHRWIAYRKICRSEQYSKPALAIEPDELLFHLRFCQPFLCNAGLQFLLCSSRASSRSLVELVRMPIWMAFSILVMPTSVSFNCFS